MKLEIYMKSGNIIELDSIVDYEFETGVGVTKLKLTWDPKAKRKLLVTTLTLEQIEAVCRIEE
jgi:hypothetical protein